MFPRASPWLLVVWLSACTVLPPAPEPMPQHEPAPLPLPAPLPVPVPLPVPLPVQPPPVPTPLTSYPTLKPVSWEAIPNWLDTPLAESWGAFMRGCAALQKQSAWRAACEEAAGLGVPQEDSDPLRAKARAESYVLKDSDPLRAKARAESYVPDEAGVRAFFERLFQPYEATQEDGGNEGLVTGYYEPLIKGNRTPSATSRFPLYAVPDDLITVDLASVYPELKNLRLRGRVIGNKLLPYATRGEIEGNGFKGKSIAWADDAVELFFLQIQGSGRIELPDGTHMRVGYADQNGHPYKSIGKLLVERGELKLEQASMQGIKNWAVNNPGKLPELLASNPSYVFFRELPNGLPGPLGALGVPLTAARSIAIDPRFIPLGAPVFLATTQPNSALPLNRLMLAQDTGGAIRGGVRADFFWGFGDAAGEQAGKMKQKGRMWVLLPRDFPLATARR
jgi:membrane-bound lytic murein transglycosylase A